MTDTKELRRLLAEATPEPWPDEPGRNLSKKFDTEEAAWRDALRKVEAVEGEAKPQPASELRDSICREMFECGFAALNDPVKAELVTRRADEVWRSQSAPVATPTAPSAQGFNTWVQSHPVYRAYAKPLDHQERLVLAALRDAWEASHSASRSYEDGVRDALKVAEKQYTNSDHFEEWIAYSKGISACITAILALLPAPTNEDGSHE